MKKLATVLTLSAAAFVAACVTINVYFPSASAERAAEEFVGDVLGPPQERGQDGSASDGANDGAYDGPDAAPAAPGDNLLMWAATGVLDLLVPSAHAQQEPTIDINTPQINAIKARMAQRQREHLNTWFDAGAIGFTHNGFVEIRDRSAVPLSDRRNLESVVAAENRDREAVYREIAVANGHPEWEDEIQDIFAQEWIEKARSGWYYKQENGSWVQK